MRKGRITISTDWHIIREGDKAQNATDPKLLEEYLRWGFLDTDLIVLGGDIFDIAKSNYDNVMYGQGAYRNIITLIQNYMEYGRLKYIYGNHDIEMKQRWKLKDRIYLPEYKTLVIHGHQFTSNLIIGGAIEGPLLKLLGWVERYINPDIDIWFPERFEIENKEHFWKKVEKYMKKHIQPGKLETVAFGHIHGSSEIRSFGKETEESSYSSASIGRRGGLAINCGCNVKVSTKKDLPKNEAYRADYVVITDSGIILKDMRNGFSDLKFD